ncbi:MAG: hypothetical protein AAGG48_15240 [Planctomycetota bacterium]
MDSPYRPPQELEITDYSAIPRDPGSFQLTADEMRSVAKLAKYLRDVGGLLIFGSVVYGLLFVFTFVSSTRTMVSIGAGMDSLVASLVLQLFQQSVTIVCLFVIGVTMRRAARSLNQPALGDGDDQMAGILQSMVDLKTLFAWKIGLVTVGLFTTAISSVFGFIL